MINHELINGLDYKEKIDNLTNVVLDVVKQNNELTKQIIQLSSKTNMTNCYNNSNNKTFNLQFFLNEQCKDALNIKDFVESIHLQLSDLENTGKLGYVEGISKIFINNLEQLDTHKRPIHCSDLKREILYIKDEDQWIKEGDDKEKIQKAIKQVANKNIMQITKWHKMTNIYKLFQIICRVLPQRNKNTTFIKLLRMLQKKS
jgi:hypothetical protein